MPVNRSGGKPVVKIGFELPEPNVHDVTGYCAAEMAVEAANRRREFPVKIELTPIIDGRDPDRARREAARFAEDEQAIGMLGPLNSAMAASNQDIYHAAGFAQLTSEASSPVLTSRGYTNFRRLVANDEYQGRALAQVAVRYLKRGRIAAIHDNSTWGRPITEIFTAEATSLGAAPLLVRGFGEPEMNLQFDDLVAAVAATKPDLVYFAAYWNKAHIIAHKLRYLNVDAVFLGSDALKPFAFLEVPSLDKEKPYHTLAGIDMRIKPSAQPFFRQFAVAYPMMLVAPQYAAEAYDCASILLAAIARAGVPDRAKVLAEVQAMTTYEGAIGSVCFDARGDLVAPEIGLYQCVDGLRKYLGAVRDFVG
jgi:branched-chain amino acid transport system substrate-binding protein